MVELSTLIEQQADLVSQQQTLLITAVKGVPTDGPKRVNDAYNDVSKALAVAIDKYATLCALMAHSLPGTYSDSVKAIAEFERGTRREQN